MPRRGAKPVDPEPLPPDDEPVMRSHDDRDRSIREMRAALAPLLGDASAAAAPAPVATAVLAPAPAPAVVGVAAAAPVAAPAETPEELRALMSELIDAVAALRDEMRRWRTDRQEFSEQLEWVREQLARIVPAEPEPEPAPPVTKPRRRKST